MKTNKIELSQILIACLIILGFSLTLISYFKTNESISIYRNIIFWLIIVPFGFESLLVCVANAYGKYRKPVDILLTLCFASLFTALIILFSYGTWPKLNFLSKYSDIIGVLIAIATIFVFTFLYILASKYEHEYLKNIRNAIYQLSKRINKNTYIGYCVMISNDITEMSIINDVCKSFGYGTRIYSLKNIFKEDIILIDENILLIIDSKDQISEIIELFEKRNNKIVGILTTFDLDEGMKSKFSSFNIDSIGNTKEK